MLPRSELLKLFSKIFTSALVSRYGELPSSSFIAREFNLRSEYLEQISQESARRWARGLALPDIDKMIIIRKWLHIDLNLLCPLDIHSVELNQAVPADAIKHSGSYAKTTKKIKATLKELAQELSAIQQNYFENSVEAPSANANFPQNILDSLSSQIAVLNEEGKIVHVNQSWRSFADANSAPASANQFDQYNYLTVCDNAFGKDSKNSKVMADGIRAVLRRELTEFTHKYPCHSAGERRWFVVRTVYLEHAEEPHAIVVHQRISEANYRMIAFP